MKFFKKNASVFVPDDQELVHSLKKTTHLGIGAHQDDLEVMALHGILQCFGKDNKWFTGVTCTNGAGSPRSGIYANYTDEEMKKRRKEEQCIAAEIGRYSAIFQLEYASHEIKTPDYTNLRDDLIQILKKTKPEIVYTHNPADKHATHVAVMISTLKAIQSLSPDERPKEFYATEVWRGLDWMPDEHKVILNVSEKEHLFSALIGVYDSQISGGKRYDLAFPGRYRSNATLLASHDTDTAENIIYAMDLTPLINDDNINIINYVNGFIDKFKSSVLNQINMFI